MTKALAGPIPRGPTAEILGRPYLLLEDVNWKFYEQILRETEDKQHLQITYDSGRMEILSPSPRHEHRKTILGSFVDIIALERDIPMCRLGSTTFRRKGLKKGLEPDECLYIANESRIRGKDQLDLDVDPPPDLVIEVDVTSRSIKREPIYAALGVAELWRHDGLNLIVRRLDLSRKEYETFAASLSFPFLLSSELNRFLKMLPSEQETTVLRKFQKWVREDG